jgi:hypothetical protein
MSFAYKIKSIQRTVFLFLLIILSSTLLFAQEKQEEESRDKYGRDLNELTLKKRGPNLDRYGHIFIGYGFIVGPSENDSATIIPVNSSTFTLGWLSKWRINRWYELGFDVAYQYSSFKMEQDSFKTVPNTTIHRKEKLVFNRIEVAPFQRFKFRNRYHSTGTFLDMGVYFGYNYRVKHQTVERDQLPGSGKTRTVNLDLDYTEDFSYGLMARVGFNRFIFYARYRFSDLFTDDSNLPELPRYNVGLKIGIHQ